MRKFWEPKCWRFPDDRVIWNFSSRMLQLEYELALRDSDPLQIINSEMWTFEIWIIKKIRGWEKLFKVWVLKLNTEMRGIKLYFYRQGRWGPERRKELPETTDNQNGVGVQTDWGGSNFPFGAEEKSQMCFPKFQGNQRNFEML